MMTRGRGSKNFDDIIYGWLLSMVHIYTQLVSPSFNYRFLAVEPGDNLLHDLHHSQGMLLQSRVQPHVRPQIIYCSATESAHFEKICNFCAEYLLLCLGVSYLVKNSLLFGNSSNSLKKVSAMPPLGRTPT